jgi:glycosyltransferase involved in cell wall biosynthesis
VLFRSHVRFYKRYLDRFELVEFLQATDIYVIPYLNPYQIASGTLSYAVASGKTVVSTPFIHAQELLSEGRGLLARFRDSASLSVAINTLLDQPALRAEMERAAYTYGKRMHWPSVGRSYARLFQRLVGTSAERPTEMTSTAAHFGVLGRRAISSLPLSSKDFPGRSVADLSGAVN